MSDFDELEAGRETADHWRDLAKDRHNRILELSIEANKLKDEIEALRKDAERYRFIRNREHEDNLHAIIMYRNRAANTQCIVGGQQADAVIDRLMSDVNG